MTIERIGILAALIGILVVSNAVILDFIKYDDAFVRNLRLAQYQDKILLELRANDKRVVNLITTQADTLEKMTTAAVATTRGKQGSPN